MSPSLKVMQIKNSKIYSVSLPLMDVEVVTAVVVAEGVSSVSSSEVSAPQPASTGSEQQVSAGAAGARSIPTTRGPKAASEGQCCAAYHRLQSPACGAVGRRASCARGSVMMSACVRRYRAAPGRARARRAAPAMLTTATCSSTASATPLPPSKPTRSTMPTTSAERRGTREYMLCTN